MWMTLFYFTLLWWWEDKFCPPVRKLFWKLFCITVKRQIFMALDLAVWRIKKLPVTILNVHLVQTMLYNSPSPILHWMILTGKNIAGQGFLSFAELDYLICPNIWNILHFYHFRDFFQWLKTIFCQINYLWRFCGKYLDIVNRQINGQIHVFIHII